MAARRACAIASTIGRACRYIAGSRDRPRTRRLRPAGSEVGKVSQHRVGALGEKLRPAFQSAQSNQVDIARADGQQNQSDDHACKAKRANRRRQNADPPAAATASGEGVSPAESVAARRPPGNAAATAMGEAGLRAGSRSRQRRMTCSIAGSTSGKSSERPTCGGPFLESAPGAASGGNARRPVNISYNTRPSA